jgi:SAM-dependent methyltransferase
MQCRICDSELKYTVLDLGICAPSNNYLSMEDLDAPEVTAGLSTLLCENCWFLQTDDKLLPEDLFRKDYAYLSSASTGWLNHAKSFCEDVIKSEQIDKSSLVVEIASNDGYLLQYFVEHNINCLGVEPTSLAAEIAKKKGVPTIQKFFTTNLAKEIAHDYRLADLIIGNNVFAHVPDLHDFTAALKILLSPNGTISLEFPHLLCLMEENQFDTIYHEHFSYFSIKAVTRLLENHDLKVFDVQRLPTHGGSVRLKCCHSASERLANASVQEIFDLEESYGLYDIEIYRSFQARVDARKKEFTSFVEHQIASGKRIAGYGAAAKGNTLLNYFDIGPKDIDFISDIAPSKQGKFTPGSKIPIKNIDYLFEKKPDVILIFPWNIAEEVVSQIERKLDWPAEIYLADQRLTRIA